MAMSKKTPRKYLVVQIDPAGNEMSYVKTLFAARDVLLKREILKEWGLVKYIYDWNSEIQKKMTFEEFNKWMKCPNEKYAELFYIEDEKDPTKKRLLVFESVLNRAIDMGKDSFNDSRYITLMADNDELGEHDLFFVADLVEEEKSKKTTKKRA